MNLALFTPTPGLSASLPPRPHELLQCRGTAAWRTDRQMEVTLATSAGFSKSKVDGNQWRQWQWGQERLEEKAGEESEWRGKSCSLVKFSVRQRCLLQITQTDLWAQHRPESEVFIVCFLPAWCAAMLVLFKVFPGKYCCCLVFPGSH